ncbi:MAG: type VI secretion system baseplate subunit TssE [Gemmataceae bacterium]|nr:type VI secretion system baseplate subunit TssE [Gemmataceae bacterium]
MPTDTVKPLLPSLLDRLIDLDPGTSREPPPARHQVLREVKASLRRDLESLLNTRARNLVWPATLAELEGSLAEYGLPDFTAASLGSGLDRARFCEALRGVIERHEPRLAGVRVTSAEEGEGMDRTFRFKIEARLDIDPAPEPILFDSLVKPATGVFEVEGAA